MGRTACGIYYIVYWAKARAHHTPPPRLPRAGSSHLGLPPGMAGWDLA